MPCVSFMLEASISSLFQIPLDTGITPPSFINLPNMMDPLIILSVIAAAGPSLMILICHFHQLVAERFAVFYAERPDYCRPERLEFAEHRGVS